MTIYIVHHVADNTLDALEAVLEARKLPFRYWFCQALTPAQIALEGDVTGLIILGGKESAADDQRHAFMQPEQQLIRNAMANRIPVFGICLGAQMMARSLGAVVEKNRVNRIETPEIGWTPLELTSAGQYDPVMRHLAGMAQFQWHEDTFHLPAGAAHLAQSERCAQQAFQLTQPGVLAYGVQFHPEVSATAIRNWLDASRSISPEQAQAIWQETEQHYPARFAASRRMFESFCDLAF